MAKEALGSSTKSCVGRSQRHQHVVVDGDPLKNLELFGDQGRHIPFIMKDGAIYKNGLSA